MKNFSVKLLNPDGAKTGCRTMTLTIKAESRKAAQDAGLAHARKIGGDQWRLHDTEAEKS